MSGSISSTNWPTSFSLRINSVSEPKQTSPYNGFAHSKHLSIHEIYHIAFLLRQVLVPDLVPQILDLADIHSISNFRKRHDLTVAREQSPQICLLTPPIWSSVRREYPVVKVVFRIQARDEGLDLGIGRSYFTAAVVRERISEGSGSEGYLKALERLIPESQRHICTNTIASDIYETHVVEWKRDAENPEEAAWVAGLKAGNRIVIKAHAQWATFRNHLIEIEVKVHTLAVVR